MAVTNDVLKGTLTGSGTQDTIRTGANSAEQVTVWFRNAAGATRTVTIYLNGTTAAEIVVIVTLLTLESCSFNVGLGSGDTLYAEASDATSINWFVSEVINP